MPSPTGRFFNLFVRLFVRRRYGDDASQTARQARRIFGAPRLWQKWSTRGLRLTQSGESEPRGEWLEPQNAADAVVFYVHGGGFISCSPRTHRPIAAALARKTDFRLFSVDYRLAPEDRFPAALEDLSKAYRWLLEQNVSPERVAFAGDSAGGGLVLSLLLRLRDENLPLPACAVCFSAWTDLTGTSDSIRANADVDDMFYPENTGEFARAYLGEASAENPLVSPVFGAYENFPPVLFHVGSTEILLDDSRRIHQKIQAAGGESHLEIYEDIFHCWQMAVEMLPEAKDSLDKAAEFIRRHIPIENR
jgi:acetyl esterase/lipase